MTRLVNKSFNRFFALGCSFTNYRWTTWPEIVAEDLNVTHFYNLGRGGAGNEFIFNNLMQVDQLYDLNENDLVMICWTNVCREDRYLFGNWETHGNIYTQAFHSADLVKKYYSEPSDLLLHDFAFVKASRALLEYKKVQWHFLQMLPIFEIGNHWDHTSKINNNVFSSLLNIEEQFLNKSFYEVLWNNDVRNKTKKCFDEHPSPGEHFLYLQKVFSHDWKTSTIEKVNELENEYRNNFLNIKKYADLKKYNFTHLRKELESSVF